MAVWGKEPHRLEGGKGWGINSPRKKAKTDLEGRGSPGLEEKERR